MSGSESGGGGGSPFRKPPSTNNAGNSNNTSPYKTTAATNVAQEWAAAAANNMVMNSPQLARRALFPAAGATAGGPPMAATPAQVLVDPLTGQHYIVPMLYQPIFGGPGTSSMGSVPNANLMNNNGTVAAAAAALPQQQYLPFPMIPIRAPHHQQLQPQPHNPGLTSPPQMAMFDELSASTTTTVCSSGQRHQPDDPKPMAQKDVMVDSLMVSSFSEKSPPPNEPEKPVALGAVSTPSTPRRQPPPVRMDIDWNRGVEKDDKQRTPPQVPSAPKVEAARESPAPMSTAFTVRLDGDGEAGGGGAVSLQDAAMRSSAGRRLLDRRLAGATRNLQSSSKSVAPTTTMTTVGTPTTDKAFLIDRLLLGDAAASSSLTSSLSSSSSSTNKAVRRLSDAGSETGTYVVENDSDLAARDAEDGDDAASTASSSSTSTSSSSTTAAAVAPPPPPVQMPQQQRRPIREVWTSPRLAPTTVQISQPNPISTAAAARNRPTQQTSVVVGPSNFKRGDGGRFSMRSDSGGHSSNVSATPPNSARKPAPSTNERPPFKVGKGAPPLTTAQREAERECWQRRRAYNPMRAAQEARENRQKQTTADQQRRQDDFVSSRSVSFHVGPRPLANPALNPALQRTRLGNTPEEPSTSSSSPAPSRPTSILAHYSAAMKRDISRLSMESSMIAAESEPRGMERVASAVQQLTGKCRKSVDLMRKSGALSPSTERLLEAATLDDQGVDGPDALTQQLARLEAAFDAVQRCLEKSQKREVPPLLNRPQGGSQARERLQATVSTPAEEEAEDDDDDDKETPAILRPFANRFGIGRHNIRQPGAMLNPASRITRGGGIAKNN